MWGTTYRGIGGSKIAVSTKISLPRVKHMKLHPGVSIHNFQ